eukprot:3206231-Alexandrium_andersonii.AAC.1
MLPPPHLQQLAGSQIPAMPQLQPSDFAPPEPLSAAQRPRHLESRSAGTADMTLPACHMHLSVGEQTWS